MTQKQRKLGLAGLGLMVLGGLAWGIWTWREEAAPAAGAPSVGNVAHRRDAPRFKLPDSSGRAHALEELKGNVVVVHFWASWCPPCLEEIPLWLDFARRWQGRPVRFVAVSLDTAWAEALKILPDAKLPPGVISVLDQEGKLPDRFGTYQYPETYLLDPALGIVSKWIGPQDWSSPEISASIEGVLSTTSTSGRDAGTLKANGGHR